MVFRVETSAQAEDDANAGETAIQWFLALDEAVASLARFPGRCPLAAEADHFPFEVRQLLYGRKPRVYRILFTVDGDTVNILHIRHGRRQPLTEQ